ncbi:acyltransferase family protein [Saccharopolyspora shandongensis]|uniref:acyltransferase family protein n=1 Tax=Saccharopolyspora shandongensis TaxID=418495 RepID=UPI0033CA2D51
MTAESPPVRQLPSLTGYRAILFIAVFLTHALGAGYFFADQSINELGTILPYGTAALATFFVLSGFVLTWGEPWRTSIGRFWRRRVVKIYPGHIIIWAATLLMLVVIGPMSMMGTLEGVGPGPILANLFLVQTWIPDEQYLFSVYGVNWSVSCEILFYLALPLLIRPILRIRDDRLWAWFAGIAALIVAIPTVTHFFVGGELWGGGEMSFAQVYLTNFFPLSRMTEFLLGVFLARIVQTGRWPRLNSWWVALISIPLCAVMYVLPPTYRISGILTIGICLFVPVIAMRDLQGKPCWLNNKPMVLLGNASYAAYLVHFPVLGLTRYLVGENEMFDVGTGLLIVFALFVVTQLLGILMFQYIERPLMRRFGSPRKPRQVPPQDSKIQEPA